MNIIVPVIPEPIRDIMDFTLLVAGANLNVLLGLVIVLNTSMYSSANCYVISLVCSNLLILLEPLQQMLRLIYNVNLQVTMNLDYVFLVTFDTAILTIILLNLEAYVVVCQRNSSLCKTLLKTSTAIKSILFVWVMCITITALELHLYDHFEREVMYDIYVSSTVMFLIFPCFIFIMLDCFVLYELVLSRSVDGAWPAKNMDRFVLLVGITVIFFLTMIPYRVVRAVTLITPASFCCTNVMMEILYTMVKIYPTVLPITCFALSEKFRRALQEMLHCPCRVVHGIVAVK